MLPRTLLSSALFVLGLPGQTPVVSCNFQDLDTGTIPLGQRDSFPLFHGCAGGHFAPVVPVPSGAQLSSMACVWAFQSNSAWVSIPQSADFLFTNIKMQRVAGNRVTFEVPYALDVGGDGTLFTGSSASPASYTLPGPGNYVLHLWIGNRGSLSYNPSSPPTAGVLAYHTLQFSIIHPEVMVTIPSRNTMTAGESFKFQIRLEVPVAHDRYFALGGIGGLIPRQTVAVIPANSSHVELDAYCHYPVGRLHVIAADGDGSAVGGDQQSFPGREQYVSQHVLPVRLQDTGSTSQLARLAGEASDARYPGPYYGEMDPRPTVGDHGAGTECVHSGGADPNPTGMPNFRLCGRCKLSASGDDRKICRGAIPGTSAPLASEPQCGPAQKFVPQAIAGQHGPGGQYETDPSKRCVVTETNEPVKVYKLDGSGTVECSFIGFSLGWFFGGTEATSKYCCYYSNTDDPAQTIPVRRCTTVTQ